MLKLKSILAGLVNQTSTTGQQKVLSDALHSAVDKIGELQERVTALESGKFVGLDEPVITVAPQPEYQEVEPATAEPAITEPAA